MYNFGNILTQTLTQIPDIYNQVSIDMYKGTVSFDDSFEDLTLSSYVYSNIGLDSEKLGIKNPKDKQFRPDKTNFNEFLEGIRSEFTDNLDFMKNIKLLKFKKDTEFMTDLNTQIDDLKL